MYSFFNNQTTNIKINELNNFETIQKVRQDLVGEIQAIIEYDSHLHSNIDSTTKSIWKTTAMRSFSKSFL